MSTNLFDGIWLVVRWHVAAMATSVAALLLTDVEWLRLAAQILLDEQKAAVIGSHFKSEERKLDSVVSDHPKGQPVFSYSPSP